MKWYSNMKLWAVLLGLALIIGTFAAVFADKVDQLKEVLPFLGSTIGGALIGVLLGRKNGNDSGVAALDALYGLLVACVFVGLLLMGAAGCGFPAALAKTHKSIKAMSAAVEPPVAAECLKRAKVCPPRPAPCPPLEECRGWKTEYVAGTKEAHRGLGRCNRTYHELKKAGVLK